MSEYSEAPKMERSVWQTERKSVWFGIVRFIQFSLYFFVWLLVQTDLYVYKKKKFYDHVYSKTVQSKHGQTERSKAERFTTELLLKAPKSECSDFGCLLYWISWISDTYCTFINVGTPVGCFLSLLIIKSHIFQIQSTSENQTFGFQTMPKTEPLLVRFYIVQISNVRFVRTFGFQTDR